MKPISYSLLKRIETIAVAAVYIGGTIGAFLLLDPWLDFLNSIFG